MERSKRNALDQKSEKLGADLKKYQLKNKELEKALKNKEEQVRPSPSKTTSAQIFDLEMEIKRLKLNAVTAPVQEVTPEQSKRQEQQKRHIEKLEAENRDLTQSVSDWMQKSKLLQKENLRLDTQRAQADKRVQEYQSEVARLTDDLSEKTHGLRYSMATPGSPGA